MPELNNQLHSGITVVEQGENLVLTVPPVTSAVVTTALGFTPASTTELAGKADTVHTHAIAQVTGLQAGLDGKAPTVHTHTVAQVTDLQGVLDGKAPTGHTHTIAQVTDLQTALDALDARITALEEA